MQFLLTYREVVEAANVSIETVKHWTHDGTLTPVKLGKRKRGAIRDNRAVRFKIGDVAALVGVTPQELRSAFKQDPATSEVVGK